jgi:hypothetical protein
VVVGLVAKGLGRNINNKFIKAASWLKIYLNG